MTHSSSLPSSSADASAKADKGRWQKGRAFFNSPYPSIFWMLFILVTCLLPKKDIEKIDFKWLPEHFDKVVHAGFYVILFVLLSFAFLKYKIKLSKMYIAILLICIFYGFLIEVLQHFFTTTRQFELLDAAANSVGSIIGLIVFIFWRKLFSPSPSERGRG